MEDLYVCKYVHACIRVCVYMCVYMCLCVFTYACVHAKLLQLFLTLCNPL